MKKGTGLKTGECVHCGRVGLLDGRPNKRCACGETFEYTEVKRLESREEKIAAMDESPTRGPQVAPPVTAPESDEG